MVFFGRPFGAAAAVRLFLLFLCPFAILTMGLGLATARPGAAADPGAPGFLAIAERRSDDITPFTKWTAVLHRHAEQRHRAEGQPCAPDRPAICAFQEWMAFLDRLRGAEPWTQIVAVNRYVNARPYIPDPVNHGVTDFWQTPAEFLAGGGDCEDFAIAKYFSLKQLGWRDDALRLVVAEDVTAEVGHATLAVRLDGDAWLLDNQLPEVTAWQTVHRYRPLFSINRSSWWLHRGLSRT